MRPRSRPGRAARARRIAAGLATLVASLAAADTAPYPLGVRTSVAGDADVLYSRPPAAPTAWPPEPSGTANLSAQAREAYGALADRMFRPATPGAADLELAVAISAAGVDTRSSGSVAFVEHDLVLRTTAGQDLGEWRVRGEVTFVASGGGAMEAALARAARSAAEELEARFEEPPGVAGWLRARGISPRPPPRGAGRRAEAPWDPRTVGVVLEISAGKVTGAVEGGTVESGPGAALGVRAGLAKGRIHGAITYGSWSLEFADHYAYTQGAADMMALGGEIGPRHRTVSGLEARGGVGLHYLEADLDYTNGWQRWSKTESHFVASIFGAVGYSGCVRAGSVCLGAGVELRRYLGAMLDDVPLDAARLSIAGFIGVEARVVPGSTRRPRPRPASPAPGASAGPVTPATGPPSGAAR